MLVGILVLLGWSFNIPRLMAFYRGITMKGNTALSFVLVGLSLWLMCLEWAGRKAALVGQWAAAIASFIGILTLSEHLIGWNLHIDQLLFKEPLGAIATTSPGRMGPNASLSFALAGISLLLLHGRRATSLAQIMAALFGLFALVAIIGYTYGASELFIIARYTGVA